MEKYETIKAIGDGAFGVVSKARNKTNNEIVAIAEYIIVFLRVDFHFWSTTYIFTISSISGFQKYKVGIASP